MAIEDAVVFGQLFSHLSSEDQILPFLNAYEEIRKERTESVLEREISNTEMVTLPPGPAKDARDASFRQARNEWDEGLLKAEFEGVWGGLCMGDRETVVTRPMFNSKGDLLLEVRLRRAIYEPSVAKVHPGAGARQQSAGFCEYLKF